MAFTASNWSWGRILTGESPGSSLSNLFLIITHQTIAALGTAAETAFWNAVDNGGGDLRVSTDTAGSNQLPLHVLICDTSLQELLIVTRLSSYTSGARDVCLFAGNSGQTQPAASASFGSEEVWQDCIAAYPMITDGQDGTGNYDYSETNAPSFNLASPWDVDAANFNGTTNTYPWPAGLLTALSGLSDLTVTQWANNQTSLPLSADTYLFQEATPDIRIWLDDGGSGEGWSAALRTSSLNVIGNNNSDATESTWQHICMRYDSTDLDLLIDGAQTATTTATGNTDTMTGSSGSTGANWTGGQAFQVFRNIFLSDDKLTIEESNQSAPGSFWTDGGEIGGSFNLQKNSLNLLGVGA